MEDALPISSCVHPSMALSTVTDAWVAFPDTTVDKESILMGVNVGDSPNTPADFIYIPEGKHKAGEDLALDNIYIPQVRSTFSAVLVRSPGFWGGVTGTNDQGVIIASAELHSRVRWSGTPGLSRQDMVRLLLERCKTSTDAKETLVSLLEEHGMGSEGSPGDASYLIIDGTSAWIIETAGSMWAARQYGSGIAAISNAYTLNDAKAWSDCHENLINHAIRQSWVEPDTTVENFNFHKAYWRSRVPSGSKRAARSLRLLTAAAGSMAIDTGIVLLRDYGENNPGESGTWVPWKKPSRFAKLMGAKGKKPALCQHATPESPLQTTCAIVYKLHWLDPDTNRPIHVYRPPGGSFAESCLPLSPTLRIPDVRPVKMAPKKGPNGAPLPPDAPPPPLTSFPLWNDPPHGVAPFVDIMTTFGSCPSTKPFKPIWLPALHAIWEEEHGRTASDPEPAAEYMLGRGPYAGQKFLIPAPGPEDSEPTDTLWWATELHSRLVAHDPVGMRKLVLRDVLAATFTVLRDLEGNETGTMETFQWPESSWPNYYKVHLTALQELYDSTMKPAMLYHIRTVPTRTLPWSYARYMSSLMHKTPLPRTHNHFMSMTKALAPKALLNNLMTVFFLLALALYLELIPATFVPSPVVDAYSHATQLVKPFVDGVFDALAAPPDDEELG